MVSCACAFNAYPILVLGLWLFLSIHAKDALWIAVSHRKSVWVSFFRRLTISSRPFKRKIFKSFDVVDDSIEYDIFCLDYAILCRIVFYFWGFVVLLLAFSRSIFRFWSWKNLGIVYVYSFQLFTGSFNLTVNIFLQDAWDFCKETCDWNSNWTMQWWGGIRVSRVVYVV